MIAWFLVPGYRAYAVHRSGLVACLATGEIVEPHARSGYLRVRVVRSDNGARQWVPVHTLMLLTFVGPRPSSRHHGAHFPDRDKTNNRVENLRWALPEENESDKRMHGTAPTGGRRIPLPLAAVQDIRRRARRGQSYQRIAKVVAERWGRDVHRTSVARIAQGLRRAAS